MPRLAVDANLVVLLVVGAVHRSWVGTHKRLSAYSPDDYDLLISIIGPFAPVVACPNVLTEASNLLRDSRDRKALLPRALQLLVSELDKNYVSSAAAMTRGEYSRLGLTDAVLLHLADTGATLLTADLDLYLAASRAGYPVFNFNHIRDGAA